MYFSQEHFKNVLHDHLQCVELSDVDNNRIYSGHHYYTNNSQMLYVQHIKLNYVHENVSIM